MSDMSAEDLAYVAQQDAEYEAWSAQFADQAEEMDRQAYLTWRADRIEDGATEEECSEEAYADYMVALAEDQIERHLEGL